jgi:hypothetical protein
MFLDTVMSGNTKPTGMGVGGKAILMVFAKSLG